LQSRHTSGNLFQSAIFGKVSFSSCCVDHSTCADGSASALFNAIAGHFGENEKKKENKEDKRMSFRIGLQVTIILLG
jgi:hypothetical protein